MHMEAWAGDKCDKCDEFEGWSSSHFAEAAVVKMVAIQVKFDYLKCDL